MTKNFLTKQLVDHFLQAEILKRLITSDGPIRFSDLKDEGIENSLFMYHANKLIDRGLITKTNEGFALTTKGARWSNHSGVLLDFHVDTPRTLVQFVIHGPNETILVVSRIGQFKKLLNDYMLPGDIYHYGSTLKENALVHLQKLFGAQDFNPELLTVADFIYRYKDGFTHHVISHILTVTIKDPNTLEKLDGYIMDWVPLDIIKVDNPAYKESLFLPMVIEKLKSFQPHEAFIVEE
jgi:hypothetical protein